MEMNPSKSEDREVGPIGPMVARSDAKGFITSANDALVAVSGFGRDELIGMHFNALYHSDMPPAQLEAMRQMLKQGLPWCGLIKNQRKGGGYFWSNARVVPVRKNGEVTGYLSVSEELPEPSGDDQARMGRTLGNVTGSGARWDWRQLLSVKNGVTFGIVFVTLMMIAGGILGIGGLRQSSQSMHTLYYNELEPVRAIGRMNFLMADNRAQVALALHHNPAVHHPDEFDHGLAKHLDAIEDNRKEIDRLLESYIKMPRDGEERRLADTYLEARSRYVSEGLMPAKAALERGDFPAAERHLLKNVHPLYVQANLHVEELLKHLTEDAKQNYLKVAEQNRNITLLAVAGVSFGILAVLVSGVFFFRGTVVPLETSIAALERITEGNLSDNGADAMGYGEPGRVRAAVVVMQVNLRAMMDEIRRMSGAIHEQCRALNHTMMNVAEQSEEQHDRVYQTLDGINRSCGDLVELARGAESVMSVAENSENLIAEILKECPPVSKTGLTEDRIDPESVLLGNRELTRMSQELAGAARIQAFSAEENASQMNQVASLIVDNREDVQNAWAVSQRLEKTAGELDLLVKNFE